MAVTSATSGAALDAALAAAERGWHTFPLAGKVPFAGSHGHLDATADPTAVRAAMTNRRAIAYGIATGAVSGVVVIDVDGDAGRDSLAALEAELGPLPDAPTVITASGSGPSSASSAARLSRPASPSTSMTTTPDTAPVAMP